MSYSQVFSPFFPLMQSHLEWIIDSILEDSKKRDLKSRDNYDESEKNEGKNGEIKREEVGGVRQFGRQKFFVLLLWQRFGPRLCCSVGIFFHVPRHYILQL